MNLFSMFRYWETSVTNFVNETIAPCGYEVKKARDLTFNEGCRLRYKFHEKTIQNIEANEIENE